MTIEILDFTPLSDDFFPNGSTKRGNIHSPSGIESAETSNPSKSL